MNVRLANSFLLATLIPITACSASDRATGTYSTLSFNEQSGDLHGLEIAIVPVDGGLVASIQIAEEGINELHLAEITEASGMLLFSTQLEDGEVVKFKMKCTPKLCIGEYTWGHADVKFTLPKSSGYWDRNG